MSRNGFIYFLRSGDFVKIGFSDQPEARKRELDTANPVDSILVGVIPGTMLQERQLHRYFAVHHRRGEWFHWNHDIERVALTGLPEIIKSPRWNAYLGDLPNTERSTILAIRRQKVIGKTDAPAPIVIPAEVLDCRNSDPVLALEALAKHIEKLRLTTIQLALAASVSHHQAQYASRARPVSAIAYFRIAIASRFDPLAEIPCPSSGLGDFDFEAFGEAFLQTRSLKGHAGNDLARRSGLSKSTICRIERGDPMFVAVVLRACRYINLHPFRFVKLGPPIPNVARETSVNVPPAAA